MKQGLFRVCVALLAILLLFIPFVAAINSVNNETALRDGIKNVDDLEDAAKGTENVLSHFKIVDEFKSGVKVCSSSCRALTDEEAVEAIKKVGEVAAKHGDEIADITTKGIKNGVIDLSKVEPEKLAQYVKGLGKDPTDVALGEEQLLRVLKAPGKVTKAGSENVQGVLVLKKGSKDVFGLEHIKDGHVDHFQEVFGVSDDNAIMNIIKDAVDDGIPGISTKPGINEVIEKTVNYNGKTGKMRVVFDITENNKGSIVTAFPFKD